MALVLSIIHVLACLLIIGVILLQSGKGGGMGAGFGGASAAATQLFGGRGAGNFLTRSTVTLASVFMITSLGLAYLSSRPNSLLDLSESSGRESSDEDTIVEQGSGDLVELGANAAPAEEPAPNTQQIDLNSLLKAAGGTNGGNSPFEIKLAPPAEPAGEEAPAADPAPAEPTPAAEPEPAAAAPAAAEPKAEVKPAAEAKPKAERKPKKPAAEAAPAADPTPAAAEPEAPAAPAEEAPAE